MIAKHIPMRSAKKSSFSALVKYMTDPQSMQERVGHVLVSNCFQDVPLDAALEIEAVQAINTRAVSDKTYHLIISFRSGENPSDEVLRAIEGRICDGLGFVGHQRVSAVHHDTDNVHMHVAINKIHPQRHTLHDPYYDHKTLAKLCEVLEREFGLEADNHAPRRNASEARAADMENHAGVESLLSWVKRECGPQLTAAQSWIELHRVLRDHGLELRERGNGFVLTNPEGITIKASSVSREFSKVALERRLGEFEGKAPPPPRIRAPRPVPRLGRSPPPRSRSRLAPLSELGSLTMDSGPRYEMRPLHVNDTTELYARYKAEQADIAAIRTAAWASLRADKDRRVVEAKTKARHKRAAIKLLSHGTDKKILYALVSKDLKKDLAAIQAQYSKDRESAKTGHGRKAWADWLKAQATAGDAQALSALRTREARKGLRGNVLKGDAMQRPGPVPGLTPDNITKAGTVIYRVGGTAIRDDGALLNVSRDAGARGLEAALRMAVHRYGERIAVNGSAEFKERIAQVAARAQLAVKFEDAALEARRQELLTRKEQTDEQRTTGQHPFGRGQHRSGDADASKHGRRSAGFHRGSAGADGEPGRARSADKPHVGRVGRKPPPESQHRLRNLSQLGVVQLAQGGEVLLPRDVSGHVEHEGAKRNHELRRDISGAGGRLTQADRAVASYVREREEKRNRGFDIKKHRGYNDCDSGTVRFAGIRQVEGESLALLERESEVIVLPVDAASVRRLKRVSIGDEITLTEKATIKTKGRSR